MKPITYLLLFISILTACNNDPLTQEQERELLNEQAALIVNLSESVTCTDAADWSFTAFGSKPCGGPWSYIAYSNSIDTEYFLQLVQAYNIAEKAYNLKWDIVSDCTLVNPPSSVECEDGKAILIY